MAERRRAERSGAAGRTVRVLLAQVEPVAGDVGANAARASAIVAEHPDADIAVFPELFLTGYVLGDVAMLALDPAGPELGAVAAAAAAAGTAVAVGFPEATGGRPANAVACIDRDGALAGVYRKTMLYGAEREAFTPGRSMLVTRLAGVLVGPMICFDAEFPEPARALARAGAELFVTASANMDPYREDHELATRARALDNRTPHAYANMVGAVGALRFCGGSRCIDRDGRVIAELPPAGEAVIAATMALGPPDDGTVDYLRCLPDDLDAVVATARAPRQ